MNEFSMLFHAAMNKSIFSVFMFASKAWQKNRCPQKKHDFWLVIGDNVIPLQQL